jgi:hypothetical protein
MRIVIEIDGTPVFHTEVPTPVAGPAIVSPSSEPPPELARAARALNAQSAGPAAFVRPARAAEFRGPTLEATALAPASKPGTDLAAGVAAAISAHPSKTSRAVSRRSKKRAK